MKNPEETATAETCLATIRFPQTDAAGIVFYPRYFEMVLRCFPTVAFTTLPAGIKTRFLKPNRLGDRLSIEHVRGAVPDDWSVTGRMNGDECFSMLPLAGADKLSASAHHPDLPAFMSPEQVVGDWMLDKSGVMHLSRYFELVNIAIEEWIEDTLGIAFHEMHVGQKIGIPTVQFNTRIRELPAGGETVSIWIRPTRLSGRTMTFVSWLVAGDRCLVENEQVVVFVKMLEQGYESVPIPGDIDAKFRARLMES